MTKPSFDYEKVDELFKNAKSIEDITGKNGFLVELGIGLDKVGGNPSCSVANLTTEACISNTIENLGVQ